MLKGALSPKKVYLNPRFELSLSRLGCKIQRHDGASLRVDDLGRWSTARVDGTMLARTLSCEAIKLGNSSAIVVDPTTTHEAVANQAAQFAEGIANEPSRVSISSDLDELGVSAAQEMLRRASAWSASDYVCEARRFHQAYPEAIEILPPDRYGDLVLLPAMGCPNSKCSFCAFYKERRFRLLDDDAFTRHMKAVCELLGASAQARGGVFLGSASALSLSQGILRKRLEAIASCLEPQRRGVGAFWDPDHCPERSVAQWQELRDLGLRSAYLGLETGLADLRAAIGKSSDIAALRSKIEQARQAGLQIGVMVLAGIGEVHQQDAHCAASAEVIESMCLSPNDIVFVSPLIGARPPSELKQEAARLRAAISARSNAKVAPYAAHRFHYFA